MFLCSFRLPTALFLLGLDQVTSYSAGGLDHVLIIHLGRFPFSQNFRNFRFGGKWNTFRRLVPLENSQKSRKSKKVVPFSRLEFPNGMSCSIYVSRSLYQFQVHRRAPGHVPGLRPNGTTFYQSEIPLLLPLKFPGFFVNGKRPSTPCLPEIYGLLMSLGRGKDSFPIMKDNPSFVPKQTKKGF